MLAAISNQDNVNISLVDMNCGISSYSFIVPNSTIYLYNKLSQEFTLLGSQGIYSVNSNGVTLLRPISPLNNISNSAVFVQSSNTLIAATLSPDSNIQLLSMNIHDSTQDQVFTSNEFFSIDGINDNRFITLDASTGNIYTLAMNTASKNVSVIQMNPYSGTISAYASFASLPSISNVEALLFVNGFVHIM